MFHLQNKTFSLQKDLSMYCRTGLNEPQTSIQQNTSYYRELVYGVIKETLKTAFPLTRKLIGRKRWKKMVLHFFKYHKCQTPQVWKLPQEFSEYYEVEKLPFKKEFVFLKSLLQYEWLEIEVFMMEDKFIEEFKENKNLEEDIIVPNPEIKILSLEYPIHLKNIKEITEEDRGQYFVSIHRDFYTKQVMFNDLSYPLVEIILKTNEENYTKNDCINLLSKYEKDLDTIIKYYNEFEKFAFSNNLFLGYKK